MTTTTTIDPEASLGRLVGDYPEFAAVFESLGIDYCCGGDTSLRRACDENGLEVEAVLERLATTDSTDDVAPAEASITELIDDVVETHHDYLRAELPSLERIVRKVARVHGDTHPELESIEATFLELQEEVTHHIADEEENVFPEIRNLEDGAPLTATEEARIREAIDHLESEHDAAAARLEEIRTLSDEYAVPSDACTSYRNALDRLQLLEEDMHRHVHKENNVLFPKAEQALESC
ncbi:iron-sulfur cluster repair di-iron protein [Natronococcus occultus]|uniref:Iron-sulfur cluster repair di-iron protein n=1 Tax=Natronococcus occultus SP4 TaxID=694430 RepID=L0K701_9EURY|nr:iron-sulfur cluster repair di-iron protein [Natronococcus occultus]AGB39903.1 iron-sulfur cluster repair di-iron protein [Natronococcus occultus SP4]